MDALIVPRKRQWIRTEVRECKQCGGSFKQRKSTQICCSRTCQQAYVSRRPTETVVCAICEQAFLPTRSWNKYCSDPCRKKSRDAWSTAAKAWKAKNRDRVNQKQRDRLKKKTIFERKIPYFNHKYQSKLVAAELEDLMQHQNGKCVLCGSGIELFGKWHVDHIMPRSKGGSTELINLQLLCPECNFGKWWMTPEEYINHCRRVVRYNTPRKGKK